MKIIFLSALVVLMLGLYGCAGQDDGVAYSYDDSEINIDVEADIEVDIYVITNRFFTQQMMEILHEPDAFIGRTIQYSGVFVSQLWGDEELFYVAQFDDCCGPSDTLGFEVYLNDIPRVDEFAWVEITGVLENYYVEGYGNILRVNAISMEELDTPVL